MEFFLDSIVLQSSEKNWAQRKPNQIKKNDRKPSKSCQNFNVWHVGYFRWVGVSRNVVNSVVPLCLLYSMLVTRGLTYTLNWHRQRQRSCRWDALVFLTDSKGFRQGNHQSSCEDELIWGVRENTICVDQTLNKLIFCFAATEKGTGFECCARGIANWWFAIVNVLVFVTFYGQPCRVNLFREIKFSFCSIFGLASFSSSAIAYTS